MSIFIENYDAEDHGMSQRLYSRSLVQSVREQVTLGFFNTFYPEEIEARTVQEPSPILSNLDLEILEDLLAKSSFIKVSPKISEEDLDLQLANISKRYEDNAKRAEELETTIYSDIHSYEFRTMGIKVIAVIDVLTLQFEVNKPVTRSDIKKYLTEKTGTRYYIQEDERNIEQSGNIFKIPVHDIRSKKDLRAIIKCLEHYGVNSNSIKVARIESSLDFYNAKSKALLLALYKSLAYDEGSSNERIYRHKGEVYPIPKFPNTAFSKIEKGYCIGVNYKGSPIYYRLYFKTRDRGQTLPEIEHRYRVEVNCDVSALKVSDNLTNLSEIVKASFKQLLFTQLGEKVTKKEQEIYRNTVQAFGKKQIPHYSKSRNKRLFSNDGVKKNADLNTLISKKVSNLVRNFEPSFS